MNAVDPLAAARGAVGNGEWQSALDLLVEVGPAARCAEGLELLAQAAYGTGELERCVSAWEDLHSLHVSSGDTAEAARVAAMLAMYLMMDTGLMAPVRGWLKRAERHLEGIDEVPAHAVIAMVRTYERFMCGDMEAVRIESASAIERGERLGVVPAVVIGRVAWARLKIFDGQVDEGLELLDEICAVLMSGGADPLTTGMMYCELICAAQGLALHDRAREWTEVMDSWRHGAAFGGINGRCRVHRAELLRISGTCDLAEEEALGACEELRPWMRREFGWPLTELGNIRLRKGDLPGAEEAFLAAHDHAWSPQPGLALLRLAQGDADPAAVLIAAAIDHPVDVPSKERPPFGDLRLAPLLDAQAEIAAVTGDVETAGRAAAALRDISGSHASRSIEASADLAEARVALLVGDVRAAIAGSSRAVAAWTDLGAPFEAAVARLVLAEAQHRSGNTDGAQMEWRAAETAFVSFGAIRWAEQAAQFLAGAATEQIPTHSGPEAHATFRRDGNTRAIAFGGRTALIQDLKGFRYLERLLGSPGREFHVLDLVAVEAGSLPAGSVVEARSDSSMGATRGVGDGLQAIDDQAREAYRRRLAEVDEDIEDATMMNDLGRLELAQRDREYLINELSNAVGLGGRHRMVGGSSERARTSVFRSVRYALERLTVHHPAVATHLGVSLRTGTYCVYAPDPDASFRWEI